MGKTNHLSMKILDVVPEEKRCTISVEIKWGDNVWHKGFTIPAEALPAFTYQDLKKRVHEEAKELIRKKQLKDQAVASLEGMLGKEISLSETTVQNPE